MRILHCCLSNYYVDNFAYQENELVAAHIAAGHEVLVIASTETFGSDMKITYLEPSSYLGSDGANVVRLPYSKWLPHKVMRKLRIHPDFSEVLNSFQPDSILFHGTCGWELLTITAYAKSHSSVAFYVDSHEDYNNSARNILSKWLLHYVYYRTILRACSPYIRKILCFNIDSMHFLQDLYGLNPKQLEFFPLGGTIFTDSEYHSIRSSVRKQFGFDEDKVIFIQSGKINRSKKLVESLVAFQACKNQKFRFLIAGKLEEDIERAVMQIVSSDTRIKLLGWLNPKELQSMLCGADVYVQPGTQSASMQMSLCCRCVVVLADSISHKPYMRENGWLITQEQSISQVFTTIAKSPNKIPLMSINSASLAAELLDYKKLAERIYL